MFHESIPERRSAALQFLILLLILTFSPIASLAQSDLSSISGTITDPTGAVVANAIVNLTNQATEAQHQTTTNRSDYIRIPGLAPGKYTIPVTATGFDKLVQVGNNLDPSLPTTANLQLVVGHTTQSVQVTAAETTLQADSATLGRV